MKTLFVAYRVADLDRSLDFYTALGYTELGRATLDDGVRLAFLKFPKEPAVTLEFVHRPGDGRIEVGGFDHLAIQVGRAGRHSEEAERSRPGDGACPAPGRPRRPEDVVAHRP